MEAVKKETLSQEIYNFATLAALREAVLKVAEASDKDPLIYILPNARRIPLKSPTGQIGIFPASFNPLTLAHVAVIEEARKIFSLEEIILILDIKNIDKDIFGASLEDRLLMLQLFITPFPYYRIGLASHGLFLHKLQALKRIYPDSPGFNFIVGYDTIARVLDNKYYADRERALDDLFSQSRFLVANRYDKGEKEIEEWLTRKENKRFTCLPCRHRQGDRIIPFNIPSRYAFITSTYIRDWIKEGKPITELAQWVPEEVLSFIQQTGLYHLPLLIEREGEKITIDRYDLRIRLIHHLFALNTPANQNIGLKKLIEIATSDTPLGEQIRKMLAIPSHCLPPRPYVAAPSNGATLLGNFSYNKISYSLPQALVEAQRCLQCPEPPCQRACPDNIPIKQLLEKISKGEFKEPIDCLRQRHPLAGMTEYLCQTQENYCEAHCLLATLLGLNHGVAIQEVLKTILTKVSREPLAVSSTEPAGSSLLTAYSSPLTPKIAIVGSGPAGLAAAFALARMGYQAHIYERKDKIGGIPRHEIPPFRFQPQQVFEGIEEELESQGIEVFTNIVIEKDKGLKKLLREGYRAIFLATGLIKPLRLNIPGEGLPQVITSVDLFTLYHQQGLDYLLDRFSAKRVIITDSGNTAMDTSRFLLRLGAEPIIIHWRAHPRALLKETWAAQREGVKFLHLCRPIRFIGDDAGNLKYILVIRTEYDSQTQQDNPIPGSEFILRADYVVHAIGSLPDLVLPGLNLTPEGHVIVEPETMATSLDGVFAGGDLVEKGNISTAIRDGKRAAHSIASILAKE